MVKKVTKARLDVKVKWEVLHDQESHGCVMKLCDLSILMSMENNDRGSSYQQSIARMRKPQSLLAFVHRTIQ